MAALSGQFTVASGGTAVAGPDSERPHGTWLIKALPGNTGVAYIGQDGADDVTSSNGYALSAGQAVPVYTSNLASWYFDVASDGDGFCWIYLG